MSSAEAPATAAGRAEPAAPPRPADAGPSASAGEAAAGAAQILRFRVSESGKAFFAGVLARLQAIDLLSAAPTELCEIMRQAGSDKSHGMHNYTQFYSLLFEPRRQARLDLFELGLGTNFNDVPSHMGWKGVPGASHRGWRKYFPRAEIFGADIDARVLFSEPRIRTYQVDQTDRESIARLWQAVPVASFDIMIDDGLHRFEANRTFLEHSLERLRPGGLYVIEDIRLGIAGNVANFIALLERSGLPWCMVQLPHHRNKNFDNCMAVLHRPRANR